MSIDTMLHDEIKEELTGLNKIQLGTEEYKVTVDGVAKLLDRANEMRRIEADSRDKVENRTADILLKREQMAEDRKDRIVKNLLTAVSIVGGLSLTVWGSINAWAFETDGVMSNGPGKEFMKKLFRMKLG